jgi:hypothetical protein
MAWRAARNAAFACGVLVAGYSSFAAGEEVKVALSGSQEIPPVTTSASGTGTINVGPDRSVTGGVNVSGVAATVVHIHEGAAGANGPIVVPLAKTADNTWVIPAGTKLTDAQYASYKAGLLYFNVHSDAHRGGEIRGQIKP